MDLGAIAGLEQDLSTLLELRVMFRAEHWIGRNVQISQIYR